MKELLAHRKDLKRRKPVFLKQDTHKKPGIAKKWSRPRGIDSKMRLKLKGYRRSVTVGWKSPTLVRGLHHTGKKAVVVHNEACIRSADKTDGLIISSTIGQKKKMSLLRIAQELGLTVLNVKDPSKFIADAEKGMAEKKKERENKKSVKEKKDDKKQIKEAKPEDKESATAEKASEQTSPEDKREQQKKEQDKLLIKRE